MKSRGGGGSAGEEEVVERRGRQKLESAAMANSKNGSKLNENSSSRSGKFPKMSSNGSGPGSRSRSRSKSSKKRRRSSVSSDSSSGGEDTDWSTSVGPSSSSESDDGARKSKKRRRFTHVKPGDSSSDESSSDYITSESEDTSRKHKSSGSRENKSGRRKERTNRKVRLKEKRSHRSGSSRDKDVDSISKKSRDRTKSRHKKERRSKHRKEGGKKKFRDKVEEVVTPPQEDTAKAVIPRTPLQATMDTQEQQKALIRHNAEMAKARLASGELQRARDEQAEMQRLYGAVDWRAKKKLRSEKKRLERTIAAGNKLANIEEREIARMDAFRVALGLPTAEAQRQAEWRAEATRALAEQEAIMKETPAFLQSARPTKHSVIGPRLPHRSPT